ncbi:hypothetical protein GJ496_000846 [Pomphorhynchus laevis]|nr:hypothetical protein GJ496_000846 [Pomphorhynchus laevis]
MFEDRFFDCVGVLTIVELAIVGGINRLIANLVNKSPLFKCVEVNWHWTCISTSSIILLKIKSRASQAAQPNLWYEVDEVG